MPDLINLFAVLLLLGGLLVWVWIAREIWQHQPVLRFEARRQVPWEGIDLLLILCAFVLFQWQCIAFGLKLAGVQPPEGWADLDSHAKTAVILADLVARLLTVAVGVAILVLRTGATPYDLGINGRRATYDLRCGALAFVASLPLVYGVQALVTHWIPYEHQLIDVVHEQNAVATWIMAVLSAVVAAPLAEEFLFRVLLQGWLEKLELSLVLKMPSAVLRQIDLPSVNETSDATSPDPIPAMVSPSRGLLGLPLGAIPIFISSSLFALTHFREGNESVALRLLAVTPLFVFGVFLGFVYQRTHRLLPSLTVHFLLNAMTMASLFFGA
jgi:membrane protease YdiL (CAAX protease family)